MEFNPAVAREMQAAAVEVNFAAISPGAVMYIADILFRNLRLRPDVDPACVAAFRRKWPVIRMLFDQTGAQDDRLRSIG